MATNDPTDLKIGVGLDTSKLPTQAAEAERTIRSAVTKTTTALREQGEVARQTAGSLNTAAEAGKRSQDAVGGLGGKLSAGTKAVGGFSRSLEAANTALGAVSRAMGVLGLATSVIALLKSVYDHFKAVTGEALNAGQKIREVWSAQRNEAERTRLADAPQKALNELIKGNERLLELKREQADFDAQERARAERAAGNWDGAAKAKLDGMLARKEITEAQHIDRTRAIEDAAIARRRQGELAGLRSGVSNAEQASANSQEELAKTKRNLEELLATGMRYGLVNQGGVETGQLERALAEYEKWNQAWEKASSWNSVTDDKSKAAILANRRPAEIFIRAAASALGVNETKDGERRPMKDIAAEVRDTWKSRRQSSRDAITTATEKAGKNDRALREARRELAGKEREYASEDAKLAETRRQQDATLAYTTSQSAKKARKEATRAAEEDAHADAREKAQEEAEAARERASRAREDFDYTWEQERGLASEGQGKAFDAISRLLSRAGKDGAVLSLLRAALSGQATELTREEGKRYGADLRLAKNGGFSAEQLKGLLGVIDLRQNALKAEFDAGQAQDRLKVLQEEEKRRTRAKRDAEVKKLQTEAEKNERRAKEAADRVPTHSATSKTDASGLQGVGKALEGQRDAAQETTAAMGEFNALASDAVAAIGSNRAAINKLAADSRGLRTQLINFTRLDV